jgi:TolB-like protein/Flp pilus assembly protein TadD
VIEGCVEKSAQQRFQSARDLALTLRAISSSTSMPESLLRRMRKPRKTTIDSIAVLPLENVGDDPESEYLSDGITEGVINRLSQLPKLKVMARSTVFRYKHRDAEPQAVGRDLRVRAVMSGRLQRVGDRLVINVELVDAQDGSAIWGEHYNRQVSDVVKLQEEMSTEIADKLRLKLTGAERKRLQKKATSNSTAYELYLKGRYHWNKRTEESVKRGIVFFREAIEADPSFANAYAGMADSFLTLGTNVPLPPREAMPKAKAAAMKAIEIDDGLAEAWASLAAVRWWYDWDWSGAEEAYQRAVELNPNYANAHDGYAMLLSARGRPDAAVDQISKATDLDPLSLIIAVHAGWPHYFAREYDAAIRCFDKALELDPNFIPAHGWRGMALGQQSRFGEALEGFRRALDVERIPILLAMVGHTYAISGNRAEAERVLTELQFEASYVSPYDIAVIHAGLGDHASAIRALKEALDDRSAWMVFLPRDPRLDVLRGEESFREIAARLR